MLSKDAQVEMDVLNKEINDLTMEGIEAKKELGVIIGEFKEIQEKYKDGDTSGAVADAITALTSRYNETQAMYTEITQSATEAKTRIDNLQEQYGVPWWQIALNVGLTLAGGFTGAGLIGGRAATAIGILGNLIGSKASKEEIIQGVKRAKNPMIEKALRRTGVVVS